MGISDRDYMRKRTERLQPGKVRSYAKPAENKPPLLERLRFFIWRLTRRK